MNDTIAAISTTTGIGAISIIRLSGPESLEIASKGFNQSRNTYHSLWIYKK